MAEEPIEQTFPGVAPAQVWAALREVVAELKYKDVREDPAAASLEFRTGLSIWSWQGQRMTATVREAAGGGTTVSVTGTLALKVQAFSWGEKKRIARKVLAGIERRVL
jgi:hypothetical protein